MLSLSKGARLGNMVRMSPCSIVMAKVCPAMVKCLFCIYLTFSRFAPACVQVVYQVANV